MTNILMYSIYYDIQPTHPIPKGGEDAGDRGDNVRGVLAAPPHLHAGP